MCEAAFITIAAGMCVFHAAASTQESHGVLPYQTMFAFALTKHVAVDHRTVVEGVIQSDGLTGSPGKSQEEGLEGRFSFAPSSRGLPGRARGIHGPRGGPGKTRRKARSSTEHKNLKEGQED